MYRMFGSPPVAVQLASQWITDHGSAPPALQSLHSPMERGM